MSPRNVNHPDANDFQYFVSILPTQKLKAKSPEDAEKGLLFMQEMLELSKSQTVSQMTELQAVFFSIDNDESIEVIMAGPSHFSPELIGANSVHQRVVYANPLKLCSGTT